VQLSDEGDRVTWSSDGYVVGVPALHELPGVVYEYVRDEGLAVLPAAMYQQLLALGTAARATARASYTAGDPIPVGARRETLFSIALEQIRAGAERPAIVAHLLAVNDAQCRPPLLARQVHEQLEGATRWAARNPTETDRACAQARAILEQGPCVSERLDVRERDGWESPVPLAQFATVPAFPVLALPPWLRAWSCAIAAEKGASVDLAAMLALGGISGGVARHVEVVPRPGWHEPVNLYLAAALEPGQRKTAIFKAAFRPIRAVEFRRTRDWQE
jgi:hypothetical protein